MSLAQLTRDQILAIYKVPPSKLGISESGASRANAEVFDHSYNKNALFPRLLRIQDTINGQILPRLAQAYGYRKDELWFEYINPVAEDKAFRLAQAATALKNGSSSVDEYRESQGLDPLPNNQGAIFYIPQNVRVVRSPVDLIEQADSPQTDPSAPTDPNEANQKGLEEAIIHAVETAIARANRVVQREKEERELVGRIRSLLSREQKAVLGSLKQGNDLEAALLAFDPTWQEAGLEPGTSNRYALLQVLESDEQAIARQYDQWKGEYARSLAKRILGEG
jgi:hypothetical protein